MAKRMKPSQVLEAAKAELAMTNDDQLTINGAKQRCICFAVNRVDASSAVKDQVKDHIRSLLGPHSVYEDWLSRRHTNLRPYQARNFKIKQRSRLAWIDSMIQYWKAQGK